jgi:hypothetical protein
MPNHSPLSRYLLIGFAVLMVGAALPDLDWLVKQARLLSASHGTGMSVRTVYVDGVRMR